MADRNIIYAAAFARSLATGMLGVMLGLFLAKLGFRPVVIGAVIAAGLAGGAVAALLVTLAGDSIGRRRSLVGLALLGAAGAIAACFVSNPIGMALVAFLGMLNGMGRDRGASPALDQAILPLTSAAQDRTLRFAWYNVLQDSGHAVGALLAAVPALLQKTFELGELPSIRALLVFYAALLLCTAVLYSRLSSQSETATGAQQPDQPDRGRRQMTGGAPPRRMPSPVSPETRRVLWKISSLFAVDSIAGGFLTTSLLAYFFFERFGASEVAIGLLFFCARAANAGSHLGAAWLARRIGLVNTMVFTHIPSSLLLLTVPFAPSFIVAAALFLIREGLVEMDVPSRQSYVMAVVRPEERTVASGVTNLVRLGGWAIAPSFAGALMSGTAMGAPLMVGASMKLFYDVLLYGAFRSLKPPEEQR